MHLTPVLALPNSSQFQCHVWFMFADPSNWVEVLKTSEDVLEFVVCADKNKLVACYMHHVKQILKV